jgi:UDP-2-acetamido-3-amino-2,3-dideoxy-glucuronate N-acetyltransferase
MSESALLPPLVSDPRVKMIASRVRGVMCYDLPYIHDERGNLTVGEFGQPLPFIPKRYFITFDIPCFSTRGEHAHFTCHQYLTCVRGSCTVLVDDGCEKEEFVLDRPTLGIYVPPMIWSAEYGHSFDSTLMVFASHHYDADDYIRDYADFLRQA